MSLLKNALKGTIPTEFGHLTNMTRLDLQQLHLEGTLPSELGAMTLLSKLTTNGIYHLLYLQLSSNFCSSPPSRLAAADLAIDQNDLASTIPAEICLLREERLAKFICDCPNEGGRGVGNYSAEALQVTDDDELTTFDKLQLVEGNCFTMCRRGNN